MEIRAHADIQPLAGNDSAENRARNRRVEIVIKGDADTRSAFSDETEMETP
jgi:flagellar motor protein MotB